MADNPILDPQSGLGGMLQQQTQEQIDEQKRRKRLGLPDPSTGDSMAVQSLFGMQRGLSRPTV